MEVQKASYLRIIISLLIASALFYLTSCASTPCPACACQTCSQNLNQCETDLNQCIDFAGRCQELLK